LLVRLSELLVRIKHLLSTVIEPGTDQINKTTPEALADNEKFPLLVISNATIHGQIKATVD
jgi:hypothetical protein